MNWFSEVLERGGERPLAEDDRGRRLSYRDALASTREWAERLGPGKRLALLLCENSTACLDAYLGLLANGHAAMLVGADTTPAIVEDLTRRYVPEIVVTCRDGAAHVELRSAARGDLNPELSVLLSTSGSTGSPLPSQSPPARCSRRCCSSSARSRRPPEASCWRRSPSRWASQSRSCRRPWCFPLSPLPPPGSSSTRASSRPFVRPASVRRGTT